jgi:hypothetical protein
MYYVLKAQLINIKTSDLGRPPHSRPLSCPQMGFQSSFQIKLPNQASESSFRIKLPNQASESSFQIKLPLFLSFITFNISLLGPLLQPGTR